MFAERDYEWAAVFKEFKHMICWKTSETSNDQFFWVWSVRPRKTGSESSVALAVADCPAPHQLQWLCCGGVHKACLSRKMHCGGYALSHLELCSPGRRTGWNSPVVFMVLWQLWQFYLLLAHFTCGLRFIIPCINSFLHLVSVLSLYSCELWQCGMLKNVWERKSVVTFITFTPMAEKKK